MDPHKLNSFLDFITSSHIIKDLPFGERKSRLSNGKVVETPDVIRCMAPAARKPVIFFSSKVAILLQQVPTLSRLDILQSTYLSK
jgi:hypothetical protein